MSLRLLAALLAASMPLAGCLGFFGDDTVDAGNVDVDDGTIPDDVIDIVNQAFRNYSFVQQRALPPVTVWFNDTVGPEANLAVENVRDEGGNDFNGVVKTTDISAYLPVGQPAEIALRLFWNAAEGQSADIDIYVDVPGLKTSTFASAEELNFNIPSKTLIVNTVGLAGHTPLVGIQAANGRTTGPLDFHLEMSFHYAKDALTPAAAYAFQVPPNATGLILESVKAGGDEHVSAKFVILDPRDDPVAYMEYDDLAIPTESVFIPVSGPGEYVFYAYEMRGGFLSLKADVALEATQTRTLTLVEERVVDLSGPAPGTVERNFVAPNEGAATPQQGGQVVDVSFAVFPLRVTGFVDASAAGGFTGAAQVRVESPKGLVHQYTRMARWDGDQGSLGYTDDEGQNNVWQPGNIAKGAWKITIINNSAATVGHTVLTYQR